MNTTSKEQDISIADTGDATRQTHKNQSEHEKHLTDMIPFKKVLESRIPLQ